MIPNIKRLGWLIAVMLLVQPMRYIEAKDFGRHAEVFEIAEEDMLKVIMKKLQDLSDEGKLAVYEELLKSKALEYINHPTAVKGLTATKEEREWYYDPSYTLKEDIKDHRGRMIHAAGTKVNPLEYSALRSELVFFDGDNQLEWALKYKKESKKECKLVLVKGAPMELMEKTKEQMFFDQAGVLVKKFGIKQIPAVVAQEGTMLKIKEMK